MSKIALIRLDTDEIVQVFDSVPASVKLPGIGSVSPVQIGWQGGGIITYARDEKTGRETAQEGSPQFAIVEVVAAIPAPDGKRIASRSHRIVNGAVIETVALAGIPPAPPEPSPIEKLQRATGMTVDEIKAALAAK